MRVIAGSLGGRRLLAPRGRDTRPTSDRIRESLFMALGPLDGARVVDLFAGSGALGIEALSRGAVHADFVECSGEALEALDGNLTALGLRERSRVWRLRLPGALGRLEAEMRRADVVLLDPPYGGEPALEALAALGAPGLLREGCRVVLEHHRKDGIPEEVGRLRCVDRRRHGETTVTRFVAGTAEARPSEDRES